VDLQCIPKVAVLMATYNGARFVEEQLHSLTKNSTPFTLHWVDDHSTDDTRSIVRSVTQAAGIELHEWHVPQHLGVPGVFFHLLESVEADIYLFCDQDDIWQPGKIDATVASLLPDLKAPVLCFSDPLTFREGEQGVLTRLTAANGLHPEALLQDSRLFVGACIVGHTFGFTRPLRDLFTLHNDIARRYASMHDYWMFIIAHAAGTVRLLSDAPTTLFRRHRDSWSGSFFRRCNNRVSRALKAQRFFRVWSARQAKGFILAAPTLPHGSKLERLLAQAKLVATFDRRQSALKLIQLARQGAFPSNLRLGLLVAASCLCVGANKSS
jgi:rhamnosyltransferase